jgi:hypothetical protein
MKAWSSELRKTRILIGIHALKSFAVLWLGEKRNQT